MVYRAGEVFPIAGEPHLGISWAWVEQFRARIQTTHSQTIERLAERGGLSWQELWAAMYDQNPQDPSTPPPGRYQARDEVLKAVIAHAVP